MNMIILVTTLDILSQKFWTVPGNYIFKINQETMIHGHVLGPLIWRYLMYHLRVSYPRSLYLGGQSMI